MSQRLLRPRRSLRSEILPVFIVLAIPVLLAWVFPYGALLPAPKGAAMTGVAGPAACAFVELNEEEESNAIVAARTAWHVNSDGFKNVIIEMFADDLPEDASGPVVEIQHRTRVKHDMAIDYEPVKLPTDLRAAEPVLLEKPEPPVKSLPFAKEELLKLD